MSLANPALFSPWRASFSCSDTQVSTHRRLAIQLAQELHLRMGDAPFAFVQFGLAANDHLFLHRQVAQHPLGSAKPLSSIVRSLSSNVATKGCPAPRTSLAQRSRPAFARRHVPLGCRRCPRTGCGPRTKGQVQGKVHAGPQPKLRNKGVGPFGPDAFEKFKGVDDAHLPCLASYVRPPVRPTSRPDSPSFA